MARAGRSCGVQGAARFPPSCSPALCEPEFRPRGQWSSLRASSCAAGDFGLVLGPWGCLGGFSKSPLSSHGDLLLSPLPPPRGVPGSRAHRTDAARAGPQTPSGHTLSVHTPLGLGHFGGAELTAGPRRQLAVGLSSDLGTPSAPSASCLLSALFSLLLLALPGPRGHCVHRELGSGSRCLFLLRDLIQLSGHTGPALGAARSTAGRRRRPGPLVCPQALVDSWQDRQRLPRPP